MGCSVWAPGACVCVGFRPAAGLPVGVLAGEERDVATATCLCVSLSGPEVRAGPGGPLPRQADMAHGELRASTPGGSRLAARPPGAPRGGRGKHGGRQTGFAQPPLCLAATFAAAASALWWLEQEAASEGRLGSPRRRRVHEAQQHPCMLPAAPGTHRSRLLSFLPRRVKKLALTLAAVRAHDAHVRGAISLPTASAS